MVKSLQDSLQDNSVGVCVCAYACVYLPDCVWGTTEIILYIKKTQRIYSSGEKEISKKGCRTWLNLQQSAVCKIQYKQYQNFLLPEVPEISSSVM